MELDTGGNVALAHDYLLVRRGAERTFEAMCELFPGSDIATLFYDATVFPELTSDRKVLTSFLQKLSPRQANFKKYLPLLPLAATSFDLSHYEILVSSSSAFAHLFSTSAPPRHVCYCHSPFRYAWHADEAGQDQVPFLLRGALRLLMKDIRRRDRKAAQGDTFYIANSEITRRRLKTYWNIDAPVLHPPVDLERFSIGAPGEHYLFVGELINHKRVDLALEAVQEIGGTLRVVGVGPEEERLRRRYGRHAEFLGRLDDEKLAEEYRRTRALIIPNVEEFGITAVEAQASGRPVIAVGAGGALETVRDHITGLLVPPDNSRALAAALSDPWLESFEPAEAVHNSRRFGTEQFQLGLSGYIAR